MGHQGGKRAGAGRPPGTKNPQTIAREAQARVTATRVQASRELTAAVVVERLRRGVCGDIRRVFDKTGRYKAIHELTEEEAACIAGVDLVRGNLDKGDGKFDEIVKVRFTTDRVKYIDLALRYHGLLVDRVKIEDDRPLRDRVSQARARLAAARSKARP